MLSLYKAVNVNEGIYYDKDTRVVVDIQLLKQFTNPEFGSKSFEMIGRLQSYNLNMKEEVLLKAVCFLCPGECPCVALLPFRNSKRRQCTKTSGLESYNRIVSVDR